METTIHSTSQASTPRRRTRADSFAWSVHSSSSTEGSEFSRSSLWTPSILPMPKPTSGEDVSHPAWGAFVPVNSATSALRFVAGSYHPRSHQKPTASASVAGAGSRRRNLGTRPQIHSHNSDYQKTTVDDYDHNSRSRSTATSSSTTVAPAGVAASSPTHTLKVPVIVRTVVPRSPTSSDSSPESSAPPSPTLRAGYLHPDGSHGQGGRKEKLHPVLAKLERSSKFCKNQMECATCGKVGRDFPACGKCRKMWCSRECRLAGGKRHVC